MALRIAVVWSDVNPAIPARFQAKFDLPKKLRIEAAGLFQA
jgi:hypothetical protein